MLGFAALLGVVASCSSSTPEPIKPDNNNNTAGTGQIPACMSGYERCGTECVSLMNHASHCGMCNKACGPSQTCRGGDCSCVAPLSACGTACVNLQSDATNCGFCGNACPKFCSRGACTDTCAEGEMACGNNCVDVRSDPTNCGTCGNVCGANKTCTNGACTCTFGTMCGGECVDLFASTQHCGKCNNPCAPGGTCINGACMGGTPQGTGGSGGAGGTGTGGATPSGGTGGAAPTGGTSNAGTGGGGPQIPEGRTCPVSEGLIADFEEGKADVIPIEGRAGVFEGYGDDAGSIMVTVGTEGAESCNQGYLHAKGQGFQSYVGVSAVLKGTLDTAKGEYVPSVYDASAYTGISFRAKKGAMQANPVRFGVATPWTEGPPYGDGSCSDSDPDNSCWNHLGHFLIDDEELTTEWKTFTFCFDRDFYPLFLPNGVSTENRRNIAKNLLKLQFQFNQSFNPADGMEVARGAPFDFYLDDVKLVKTPCDGGVFQSTPGTKVPFGTNAPVGSCMPATDAEKFNKAISQAYARWKQKFINGAGAVYSPEQNNDVLSEGIGYGMLITAAMGDKETFDRIWKWAREHAGGGLLGWRNGDPGSGSATDGDTDMAYALIMAEKQWGGGGYQEAATALINAIKSGDLANNRLKPGNQWDGLFNPSYFSPGFYRVFGSDWAAVTSTNFTLFNNCDQKFGNLNGIVPDWCDANSGAPSPPMNAQVTSGDLCPQNQACYTYDAARTPWRMGYEACLGGSGGMEYVNRLMQTVAPKHMGGARIDLMRAGWNAEAEPLGMDAARNQMSFIGPMGVAAMASPSHSALRDRAFRTVLDIIERPEYYKTYYATTVGMLTLLMMSGNWPAQ